MGPTQGRQTRGIGAVGTVGRVVVGLGFLYLGLTHVSSEWRAEWIDVGLALGAIPAGVVLFLLLRSRFTKEPLRAYGLLGYAVNCGVGAVLFSIEATQPAAFLFYGSTLLLAATWGYAGCEIFAISNFLLRRNDQVGCAVFTPMDAAEARLTGAPSLP